MGRKASDFENTPGKKEAIAKPGVTKTEKPKKEPAPKKEKPAREPVEAGAGRNVVDTSRYQYPTSDVLTASGRKSKDANDTVATALRGKSLDELFSIVTQNGLAVKDNWRTINAGLARMAAGNALRGVYNRTGVLKIGDEVVGTPKEVPVQEAA